MYSQALPCFTIYMFVKAYHTRFVYSGRKHAYGCLAGLCDRHRLAWFGFPIVQRRLPMFRSSCQRAARTTPIKHDSCQTPKTREFGE